MQYWILTLTPIFLLLSAPTTQAHNLISVGGNNQEHQHVYRRQQYGKPLQQGHVVKHPGGGQSVSWENITRYEYGKSLVPRNGPILEDRTSNQHKLQGVKKRKFGSQVQGYGKAARKR